MIMPGSEILVVEPGKLAEYLLSPISPGGRYKAAFFRRFGYTIENIAEFAEALKEHGQTQQVAHIVDTQYGRPYNVDGALRTPDGRNPHVRTVWQVEPGSQSPRLITAFPSRS